jgi:hypothetical protein
MKAPLAAVISWVAAVLLVAAGTPARAGDFDGSKTLLCAPSDAQHCTPTSPCERVVLSEVDVPAFIRVRFDKKRLESIGPEPRTSAIENQRVADGQTILQGAELGRAWSLLVDHATGRMSASAADAEGAFVLFGACTPD